MDSLSPIAIIAMTGKFPNAETPQELWHNLLQPQDCFIEFTENELLESGLPATIRKKSRFIGRCPRLRDATGYDAEQLGCLHSEAAEMAPQARLMLSVCRELLAGAGYSADTFPGLIGFWGGQSFDNYALKSLQAEYGCFSGLPNLNGATMAALTPPLAKVLKLSGPVVQLQTACSTSLVAIHQAALSLQTYQCDIAIAGGVSIQYAYLPGYPYREGEIFSPNGYCKPFDSTANGTVFGEGCGAVLLRRLEDATADGDTILGVIQGSAINNDGAARAGFTAPGVEGQLALLKAAYSKAGISPKSVQYIETHGTGTPLGDPLEFSALKQFFSDAGCNSNQCALGALKGTIGHLDAAAGVAGLIKLLLIFRNRALPVIHNFSSSNPELEIADSPFYVPSNTITIDTNKTLEYASISSFGLGGTNAHIVLKNPDL